MGAPQRRTPKPPPSRPAYGTIASCRTAARARCPWRCPGPPGGRRPRHAPRPRVGSPLPVAIVLSPPFGHGPNSRGGGTRDDHVLRHERDPLRQRGAAPRLRTRAGPGRRPGPLSPSVRRRHLVPHRHRREQPHERAGRGARRAVRSRSRRSQRRGVSPAHAARSGSATTTSCARRRTRATGPAPSRCGRRASPPETSIAARIAARTACGASGSMRPTSWSTAAVPSTTSRPRWSRRRTTSSGCRATRSGSPRCSIAGSCAWCPRRGIARCARSWTRVWRTSASRAARRERAGGACPSPAIPRR